MNCLFISIGPGRYRCQRCGQFVRSPHRAENIHARCNANNARIADDEGPTSLSLRHKVWNLARALAAFVADGLRTVTAEQYAARLGICDSCQDRRGDRCSRCGCRLSLKARGKAFRCPLNKWPNP